MPATDNPGEGVLSQMLGADPLPWILDSDEPAARWVAYTHLVGGSARKRLVAAAHTEVLADPGTDRLISRLPQWDSPGDVSGHQSPGFAPNLLGLLADMGVSGGEDERIEALLDDMAEHRLDDGRFMSFGKSAGCPEGAWGSLFCDHHAITEVLLRFGRGGDPRVKAGLKAMTANVADTAQGRAWPCVECPVSGFRGPGRKGDFCPQVTLEALRCWSHVAPSRRPAHLLDAARTVLGAWRARGDHQPYMFGHGYRFKVVKWPTTWYDVHGVLDTLGHYPALWRGEGADPSDRRSLAELAACLVAYNFSPDATVTPLSCYQGFTDYSFGQKKVPSPFATARLCAVISRFEDLVDDVAAVDVTKLGSSKGGTGTPRPPKR